MISFDSSTNSTGYSIYVNGKYKESGVINKKDIKDSIKRINDMISEIYKIIDSESPNIIVWETPVMVNANPETQRTLDYIVGSILGKCIQDNIFYYSYRPSEWRNIIKNKDEKLPRKRTELKIWGKGKVKDMFDLDIDCDDITDSILLGQAYIKMFS